MMQHSTNQHLRLMRKQYEVSQLASDTHEATNHSTNQQLALLKQQFYLPPYKRFYPKLKATLFLQSLVICQHSRTTNSSPTSMKILFLWPRCEPLEALTLAMNGLLQVPGFSLHGPSINIPNHPVLASAIKYQTALTITTAPGFSQPLTAIGFHVRLLTFLRQRNPRWHRSRTWVRQGHGTLHLRTCWGG